MPRQEEHEKPENLVESPHLAEHTARSLQEAADSEGTLEGYYSINDAQAPEQEIEQEERAKNEREREKARP